MLKIEFLKILVIIVTSAILLISCAEKEDELIETPLTKDDPLKFQDNK